MKVDNLIKMIIVLLGIITNSAFANDNDGEAFLKNYGSTVVLLNSINTAHVNSLMDCACYMQSLSKEKLNPLCKSNYNEAPEFIKMGINFYGKTFSKNFTCQNILENMVYKRLELSYEEMRLSMGLMKSEVEYAASPELSETFGNLAYEDGTKFKITVTPKHNVKKMPWDKVPLKTPAPFNDSEIESMLTLYKEFGYTTCENALQDDREKIIAGLHPKFQAIYEKMDNHTICSALIESNEKSRLKTHFLSILYKMKTARISEFRQEYKETYAMAIQANPLLGLVSSSNPELDEVIEGLGYIASNASKRLVESQTQLDKKEYLQFMQYSFANSYAKVIWESKGLAADSYNESFELYSKKFESKEFKKDMLIVGGLVGVSVACAVPWGKALSVALQFAKLSCLSGLGIPINTYFFIDSLNMYSKAVTSIFSHLEPAYKMEKYMDKLDGAELNIGLSALFLPVGMGLVEAKKALNVLQTNKVFKTI